MTETVTLHIIVATWPDLEKALPLCRDLLADQRFQVTLINTDCPVDDWTQQKSRSGAMPLEAHHLWVDNPSPAARMGIVMSVYETLLLEEKPTLALIFGDTDAALAATITAAKLHVPVFHPEAALRSGEKKTSAEINRILIDRISDTLGKGILSSDGPALQEPGHARMLASIRMYCGL